MWGVWCLLYLGLGILLTFIVVFKRWCDLLLTYCPPSPSTRYLGGATDVRAGMALFYVLTNVTILAKCPLGNRHTNHRHMTEVLARRRLLCLLDPCLR